MLLEIFSLDFYNEIDLKAKIYRKDDFMEFGENLRKAREEKGITQQTLAEKLFVTRQAVSKWECGSRYPDLLTTKCIANILDVSIDSLVSNDEMKDFTEKQSITGGQRSGKIITTLYAVITLLCILKLLPTTMNIVVYHENYEMMTNFQFVNTIIVPLLLYVIGGILALVSFVKSIKDDITPKVAGAIGMLYFTFLAIKDIFMVAYHGVAWKVSIICILIIKHYFFANKIKLAKPVCVICIVSAIFIIANQVFEAVALKDSISQLIEFASLSSLMELFINLSFIGILLYQTIVLERKRKLAIA